MEARLISLLRLSPYIFFLYTLLFPVISRAEVALGGKVLKDKKQHSVDDGTSGFSSDSQSN
jgi:hypothetical protein